MLDRILWSEFLHKLFVIACLPLYWLELALADEYDDDLWREKMVGRLYRMHAKGL